MYFFRKFGKQFLDLRGNLILSHNSELVRARVKSSAPRYVRNAKYIDDITGFRRRWRATWAALRFIWGSSTALEKVSEAEHDAQI